MVRLGSNCAARVAGLKMLLGSLHCGMASDSTSTKDLIDFCQFHAVQSLVSFTRWTESAIQFCFRTTARISNVPGIMPASSAASLWSAGCNEAELCCVTVAIVNPDHTEPDEDPLSSFDIKRRSIPELYEASLALHPTKHQAVFPTHATSRIAGCPMIRFIYHANPQARPLQSHLGRAAKAMAA